MNLSTAGLVLAPAVAIDLHLHTDYSDGDWTPAQLLETLVQEQFGLAAITDHDRTDTAAALQQLALEKRLPVLTGVEMTTLWHDETGAQRLDELSGLPEMTDLLCYGFAPGQSPLFDLAQDLRRRQGDNTREVFENLQRKGYVFPQFPDALAEILEKPSPLQPHELAALVKRGGYGSGEPSAGRIVLEAGCAFAVNDLAAVVDAAHRSGAVCLIAHPGKSDGFVRYEVEMLDRLRRSIPIDGLEVYHPVHSPAQAAMYLEYVQCHHLLASSGSDSHRPEKPPKKYPAELSWALLERLGIAIH